VRPTILEAATITELFFKRVQAAGSKTALRVKKDGHYTDIRWTEFGERVRSFSRGLLALGLRKGDNVALVSRNRPEFAYSDLGILSAGGVTVAIYTSSTPHDIAYIINHSEARFLIVDSVEQLKRIQQVRAQLTRLEKIILIDEPPSPADPDLISFAAVCELGNKLTDAERAEWERGLARIGPDDLIAIIYTSGTTGPPKGALLTHRNVLSVLKSSYELYGELADDETFISYLPLAHSLERIGCQFMPIYIGGCIGYAESLETVGDNIREVRPTLILGVPRFFEKVYNRIIEAVEAGPPLRKKIFYWAVRVGEAYNRARDGQRQPGPWLQFKYRIAKKLVFDRMKERMGGRVRVLISGGAPLNRKIAEFFYSLGLVILEGYGATETAAPATMNRPGRFRFGTVGTAIPGVDIKLADDGEILIRGDSVFKGYYKDPEATRRTLVDGWYYSGDIGRFDEEGNLVITDRKKDLIITAAGKNIAPQNIENFFKTDPRISEMVVLGDKRKYLVALIVPNPELMKEYAAKNKIAYDAYAELVRHPRTQALIDGIVAEKNRELASYEKIKKYTILDHEFSIEAGHLTPTMKVKRKVVAERYKDLIDAMYEKEYSTLEDN
jgi:long-chain acyl-CoA synthetase